MWEFTQHAYSLRKRILILLVLAFFASKGGADLHSESCTREQSTKNRQLFNFRKFGNASGLEQCVDFCCRDDTCELAIFSRGFHCYGVSCDDPELCHKILDRLLMEDERQLQRDPRNAGTRDFIRHTSQVTNPRCPKRFVPSFHVLLLGTSTPREFQKLHEQSDVGTGQCSVQCCKSRDCLLSFIENEECYGVTRVKAWNNSTKATQEPRVDLQVAIIDRNKEVSRSLDEEDEDPDDLGSDEGDFKQEITTQTQSKPKQPELKVNAKLQSSPSSKVSSATNDKTKTNGSNVFKKKGSSQNPARLTIKLHGVQPSVQVNTNRSKGSHKSRIVRPNTTSSPPSKGLSSHITPAAIKSKTLNPIDAIVKLATTYSSSAATSFKSAGPSKRRTVRTKAILLSSSKGLSSHRTPPVTKSRALNPIDAIVKLATTYLNSAAKQDKRAAPSKARHTTNVKTTTKRWKTGTKRGIQRIHTEIKHDVKHIKQTTKAAIATVRKPSGANSKAWKTDKIDQGKSYKSLVAKSKSYISVKEGSSRDEEGSVSGDGDLSGDNKVLAREHSDLSGEGTDLYENDKDLGVKHTIFSGEDSDLSGDENGLSGDDIDVGRKHNDFSGDKDLSGEGKDKDSSEINNDLMEDNEGLSGDDNDLGGDSDDQQRRNHREMQQKTYVGEDKEGPIKTKIDLKDLDELGSDEDVTDQSNKEQSKLSSGKLAKLPQRERVTSSIPKTTKNSKKVRDEHIKSKQVTFHPKQAHVQKRKQATSVSSAEFNRPLHGENKLKKDSHISTRPSQSGPERHSVISSRPTSTKRSNESAKNRNGSGRKATTHHKQTKTIKSTFFTTKNAKPRGVKSSFNRGIKTKGTNKGTKTSQSHTSVTQSGIGKHGQSIKKDKRFKNRPKPKTKQNPGKSSLSRTTLKVAFSAHQSKTVPKAMYKGHVKAMGLSQKTKNKSVKGQVRSQKQIKIKDESSKSESNLENANGANTNTKHRKSLESGKLQEIQNLQSKEKLLKDDHKKPTKLKNDFKGRQKEGKLKFPNSNSTLEDIGDLMHYAHRKVSLKDKPLDHHIAHYVPTKKRETFDSTAPRQQETTVPKESFSFKKFKANHNETTQGNKPSLHPKLNALQKESKSQGGTTTAFQHPRTESLDKKVRRKLAVHKSLATTPTISSFNRPFLSTAKSEDVSLKENSYLPTHPSFTTQPLLNNKDRNSSERNLTSSNNAILSMKQPSNTNTSDTKDNFLAHFHQADSSRNDGVDFAVKSRGKHHRRRGKQDEAIDVEDLGDADFDIMMSNDIPHKDLPKKGKVKQRYHKHAGKDEDTKDDDRERRKKRKKGSSHVKDKEDDTDESEKSSTTHHSSHKHKDKSSTKIEKSTTRRHHHHHHHQENGDTDKDADERKEAENESHQQHRKHDKSTNSEEKEGESDNHHHNMHKTRMRHVNKGKKDDGDDDDASREETKHQKHHHSDAIKARKEESRKENSENDETKENRHHHKHKKHYDDNHWEGKIIPGRVKVTYEEDSGKERHHKHHIKDNDDNSEMKKEHHKRKHTSRVHETHSDSDEETDIRKHLRHSKEKSLHNHDRENDDEEQRNENHTEDREDDQEKHHFNDEHKKEKQEHAEKRTDVNYEVVKKDRHRLVHNEDNDDNDNESKSKHYDKDNGSDEKQDREEDEDKAKADDDSDNSENEKHNRVVLGEDSESDEEDEDKHVRGSHEHHDSHGRNEHRDKERENADDDNSNSHEEDHKSVFHNRHEQERHWESKHKHYQFHDESNEADNDDNDDERNNFRKSFIYHRKRKKQRRLRQHYEKEKEREEEYNNGNQEKEFHAIKHHPYDSYKHRHHHYRPRENDNKKIEKYEDRYEPKKEEDSFRQDEGENERKYEHNEKRMREYHKQHEESEEARFRNQMKEHRPDVELEEHNAKHFHHERQHDGYISHEDDHDRKFEGPPFLHDQQDEYEHRFMGGERPSDDDVDHRTYYKKGPKYEPRHRKKSQWKHRHHFHDNEWHDIEGTGGLFDSSAWMRDENSDDDDHGGEGNQEYYRRRHHKHKHRKHRQSYEYWAYGEQNPYYYDYNYYKSRPRYGYYKPRLAFRRPAKWHKYRYGGYDHWKPKPTQWYRDKGHWDRKSPWRPFQESRPTEGYQWQTFSSDRGFTNQPKPTAYPRETSRVWPPTNPRWQRPDETQRGFGGDNWPPGHGRGPGKQYNDWSKGGPSALLNQDAHNYQPQQNPPPGLPPSRTFSASKPGSQQQPTGVQSKYVPPAQPKPTGVVSQARFRPTVRRQYAATPLSHIAQVSNQANISQIKIIMDKLNTPSSAVGGQQAGNAPTVNQGPVQNISSKKDGIPKMNLTATNQTQDEKRLNGFFNEENGGKKKSEIVRPTNVSHDAQAAKHSSSSANTSQHVQQTPPRTTNTPAKPPPQTTQVANITTIGHTTPMQTTSSHTSKPTQPTQNSSTTVRPTQTTATEHTPAAPNFGDVSQSDDSSETGKKHRKHRAPVCIAGKTTDDVTLLLGKRAGNFTNIGDVGDFEMCIKRCCQQQKCDLAFKSAETCFLVNCFSQESCKTSPSLDDIFSPRMCFVRRHSRDDEKESPGPDGDDEWDDKVSPSGIREVCDAEKALGILWKKTIAGRYSAHPCPRGAQGFVKRRCEADSRWLPPDFSECVSKDYQTLFDKSKKLATGADPSPLIRELSQLTTQNIDNSLIFGGDLNRATDIMAAIVQHNGQTELLDMTREDVENFVRASSNLLDMTNQQEWFNIQRNKPGTADVLRSMEMFALQAAMRLPREDMADPTITNNIIIKMDRKSPGDGGLTFPDFSNPRISRWDARHDIIALPSSVFDRGEVSTASISFKSLPYLLPDSNVSTGLGPNSKVISTVLHPHPQEKINPPVTVVLSHIKRRRGNPKCVFWDYTLSPHRGGAWSSRGCRLAFSNHSHSICQCSHLSNFAVLMDLSSDEVSQKEQKRERTMALMWIGIPVLIVGVIGGLYMSFSWNRKSGMPGTMTRPSASLNEKTGLLGQRVVTSQVREEFPASPTRDLYRALSPGYSPTGDLEWQDEFDFELGSGDQGFKQMLLPKLQMLQKHLINEFYDGGKIETKKTKQLLESKIKHKSQITAESPVQCDTVQPVLLQTIQHKPQVTVLSPVQPDVVHSPVHREQVQPKPQNTVDSTVQSETVNRQVVQPKSQIKAERPLKSQTFRIVRKPTKTTAGRKLRVRFADDSPPGRNLTDEDKERFKRLQRMERRVFVQHLSRWTASSRLNLPD